MERWHAVVWMLIVVWEKNISRGELAILGTYEHPRNRKLKVRYGKDDMIRAQGYNNAVMQLQRSGSTLAWSCQEGLC